jgi:hypothetical protein
MTLIASFAIDDWPILLGDLLLSSPTDGMQYQPFVTPLHSDPNKEMHGRAGCIKAGSIAVGLRQKVILLNKRLAIAWSGFEGRVCN